MDQKVRNRKRLISNYWSGGFFSKLNILTGHSIRYACIKEFSLFDPEAELWIKRFETGKDEFLIIGKADFFQNLIY